MFLDYTTEELIEYKRKLEQRVAHYHKMAKKIHAFIHVTNIHTGNLIWGNASPFRILKYTYPSCQSLTLDDWKKHCGVDSFRALALETVRQKTKETKRLYRIPYQEGKYFHLYESLTVQPNQIIGITVDASHQVHTSKSLQTLLQENKKLQKQLEIAQLSPKEQEVLRLLAQGHSTKVIAQKLGRSYSTVHSHRKRIMRRLKCKNIVELTRFAIESGIY